MWARLVRPGMINKLIKLIEEYDSLSNELEDKKDGHGNGYSNGDGNGDGYINGDGDGYGDYCSNGFGGGAGHGYGFGDGCGYGNGYNYDKWLVKDRWIN